MNKYLNSTTLKIVIAAVAGYYVGKNGVTVEVKKTVK
jgi:hypothetical protein